MTTLSPADQSFVAVVERSGYVVATLVLAALWTVESLAPMYAAKGRRIFHGLANLGLAALNAVIANAFLFAILYVTESSREHGWGLLHLTSLPWWLHWPLAMLLFDCWQYWWHRMNHRLPFLWRFHAVHHADGAMDATSAVRFHSVEITLSFTIRLLVLPLIGITVPQLLLYETITLPVILFHHSNIRLPHAADLALRWLIVTPWMHWVHHSRWQPETDSNYSSFLSIWDRLFGSFRLRQKPLEIVQGLDGWEEREWRGLAGMLLKPLGRKPLRVVFAGFLALLWLLALGLLLLPRFGNPNELEVRNSSGEIVRNLRLIYRHRDDPTGTTRVAPTLAPGQVLTYRHAIGDMSASLEFELNGSVHRHQEEHIDFWRGETWRFDIQRDGKVESSYLPRG